MDVLTLKTLGVTGGIGSGKTTVCRMLEACGARVFYADQEGKRILQEDPAARDEVIAAFGPASYGADGRLDRPYLAAQVFGDEAKVAQINRIVHPRVFAAFEKAKVQAEADGIALLVKEAALIFEAGGEQHLDAVAAVLAPQAERLRRVTSRDGVTREQVRARMAHQLPPEELRRRADYVIENDGDLEDLQRQVQALYQKLVPS